MKAIVREKYGAPDVLELKNVPKPVVDDDSVLVRVRAASINAYLTRVLALSRYEFVRELSLGSPGYPRGAPIFGRGRSRSQIFAGGTPSPIGLG